MTDRGRNRPFLTTIVRHIILSGALILTLLASTAPPTTLAGDTQTVRPPVSTATAPIQDAQANLYDLQDLTTHTKVTYSTSSFSGKPQLSYTDLRLRRTFQGTQIRVQQSEIGMLVSVTLEQIPDLRTVTFTLLVPAINPQATRSALSTTGILTTNHTSIGGPRLVKGPLQTYRVLPLQGTASVVEF